MQNIGPLGDQLLIEGLCIPYEGSFLADDKLELAFNIALRFLF